MKYYCGVYLDDKQKVMQVSDTVDGLSCEILANPGVVITNDFKTTTQLIKSAKIAAEFLRYAYLEINTTDKYEWIKITA